MSPGSIFSWRWDNGDSLIQFLLVFFCCSLSLSLGTTRSLPRTNFFLPWNQNKLFKQPSLVTALNYSGTPELILIKMSGHLSAFKSLTRPIKSCYQREKINKTLTHSPDQEGLKTRGEVTAEGLTSCFHDFLFNPNITCWQGLRSDGLRLHNLSAMACV